MVEIWDLWEEKKVPASHVLFSYTVNQGSLVLYLKKVSLKD